MRYYIIKKDPQFFLYPSIKNYFGKVDIRNMRPGSYDRIPDRLLLQIRSEEKTIFTNVIVDPFFLVSEVIKECVSIYEPNMFFKEIILLDRKYRKAKEYFLPTLEEVECLTSRCEFNLDHSRLLYTEIDDSKVEDKSIFYLSGVSAKYVVVRLDIAESMIRRGANGFLLEEVDCRRKG